MPVREAFQTLEQEGFLLRLPNRHMRVIEITNANIRQYFTTLIALERSFFQQLLDATHPMDGIVAALKKAIGGKAPDDEVECHIALASALGNEYLLGIHRKLLGSFYLHALQHHWKPSAAKESLQAILDGVIKEDTNALHEGLRAYFTHYEKLMLRGKEI